MVITLAACATGIVGAPGHLSLPARCDQVADRVEFRVADAQDPHAWVVANLGMAGLFAPAILLANLSAQLPLPPWSVMAWWGCTGVSSLAALLLLLVYEGWHVHRGYRAWSVLAQGEKVSLSRLRGASCGGGSY